MSLMKTVIIALILAGCATELAQEVTGQRCYMQIVGQTDGGITVVDMACRKIEGKE